MLFDHDMGLCYESGAASEHGTIQDGGWRYRVATTVTLFSRIITVFQFDRLLQQHHRPKRVTNPSSVIKGHKHCDELENNNNQDVENSENYVSTSAICLAVTENR